jgi:hypothetical protein
MPSRRTDCPTLAREKPGEAVLGERSDEVVADFELMLQKVLREYGGYRMRARIVR